MFHFDASDDAVDAIVLSYSMFQSLQDEDATASRPWFEMSEAISSILHPISSENARPWRPLTLSWRSLGTKLDFSSGSSLEETQLMQIMRSTF